MTALTCLDDSSPARVEKLIGEQIVLRAIKARPPGSTLIADLAGAQAPITVKVRACRREGDEFVIEGRLVNLSREQRLQLAALLTGRDPG